MPTASPQPLARAPLGSNVRVTQIDLQGSDAVRLKRLGICVGREVQLLQAGDPLIALVAGSRIGISRRLAAQIQVQLP